MILTEITSPQEVLKSIPANEVTTSHAKQVKIENQAASYDVSDIKPGGKSFILTKLDSLKSRLNEIATTTRHAKRTMEQIENFTNGMKSELGKIEKSFPPFPPGSEERVKILKSYSLFWKQIDRLNIPPVKEFEIEPPEHKIGPEDKSITEYFDVPNLLEDASDEEVFSSLEKLNSAGEKLKKIGYDLSKTVSRILGYFEKQKAEVTGAFPEEKEELALSDKEALIELTSKNLGYELAFKPGLSLTEAQSQLLNLVN